MGPIAVGGDHDVVEHVSRELVAAGHTIAGPDDAAEIFVVCDQDAIEPLRRERPRATILAILPDAMDIRRAFTLRNAVDAVLPRSQVSASALALALERAVERRDAHLKQILVDLASDGMALVSKTGITLYVNPAFERILGRPASEIVGKHATILTHPEDVASGKPPPPGGTTTRLGRSRHADGSYRWLESVTRNCTEDPEVSAYVVTFRDVTEHRAVERNALVTQRRLEYLLSSTRAVTYTCVPRDDFRVTFMSESVREVLGWNARDFMHDPSFWWERLHPDDRADVERDIARAVEAGHGVLEYRFKHADGSWRFMHDELRIYKNPDGDELIGFWVDVSPLRRSEHNFRTLIEASHVATFVHRRPKIVYANPACAALLGYERAEELLGMDGMMLVHPDDRARVLSGIERTSAALVSPPSEVRLLRKDGTIVFAEGQGILLDFDGAPSHVVMNRDVSERHMLFERAAAADRMRAVGTLAAGVAHEINSPLAFVSNTLQALSRGDVAPGDKDALLGDALAATERIASIASSLRTMSHARDEALEPVDVVESLKFAIKMLAPELRSHVDLVESYAPGLPRVHAQQGRLGQVFINLLLNAAQATREAGRGEVRVIARRDGDRVIVEVSDTGPGIPESLRSRVFEPFFTTKPVGMGTGLGLAICRTIVAGFGGEIALDTSVAQGATFRVKLPIVERRRPTRKLRIMLLDDDESFVKTLCMMLERDHEVRATTRADDALAVLEGGERFDAILCDVSMPGMSGMAFRDRVDALATEQARRIVYISGASGRELDSFFERVDNKRLPKPFRAEELERILAEITA